MECLATVDYYSIRFLSAVLILVRDNFAENNIVVSVYSVGKRKKM